MEVRCDRCQSECKLEDAQVSESGLSVQCADCGHTILIPRDGTATQTAEGPGTPEGGEWVVDTTHGRTLRAPDMATLHRWIIERRVTREDRVSHGGQAGRRIGDVAELVPFFDVADSAERARRSDTPGPMPLPAPPVSAAKPVAAPVVISAGRRAFEEAEEQTETRLPRARSSGVGLPVKLMVMTVVAAAVAYAGIALQQWYARSSGWSTPAPSHVSPPVPTESPKPTPPAPAAEVEPLAGEVEPAAAEPEGEPEPSSVAAHRKGRAAARAAAARPGKAAPSPPARGKADKASGGGPSPQIAAAQGYAAMNRRQYPQAIELFKQALAGNPSNGTALFGLAEAYRESGLKPAALKAYRRYVQILPSGPDAGSARLQIRLLEGKSK